MRTRPNETLSQVTICMFRPLIAGIITGVILGIIGAGAWLGMWSWPLALTLGLVGTAVILWGLWPRRE